MSLREHEKRLLLDLFTTGMCRPVVQYGSGRRTTYVDHTDYVLKWIDEDRLEFGNDAPRGGAMGKYIKLKN